MGITLDFPERKISISFIFRVLFPVLLLCLLFDIVSGVFFGVYFSKIAAYPAILIMIPALMGLRGNIFGALGSRISTKLYLGEASPSIRDNFIKIDVAYALYLSLILTFFIWILSCFKLFSVEIASLKIVLLSCIITSSVLGLLTAFLVVSSFKRGIDPDSILGPGITTAADLVTLPTIILAILLFEVNPKMLNYFLAFFIIILLAILLKLPRKSTSNLKIMQESLNILFFLALIQYFTGSVLQNYSKFISKIMFLAYAYPPTLDFIGNIGSVSSARISTKLHLGEIKKLSVKEIREEFKLTILAPFVAAIIFASSIFFQRLQSYVITSRLLLAMSLFFGAIIFLVFLIIVISFLICVILHKKNIDPDNGAIPTITVIGDLLGTFLIVTLAIILSNFKDN